MIEKHILGGPDRKNMNEEAASVNIGALPDPMADLPRKFHAVAKVVNDGRDLVIYLPEQFLGRLVVLEVHHLNALYITAGMGYPVVEGHHVDDDKNIYKAKVILPSEIIAIPLKRIGVQRHICTRNARKILMGNMLNKLTSGFSAQKIAPVTYRAPRQLPSPPAPAVVVPEIIVPQADPKGAPTAQEREMLRMAQGILNDAIKNKGYTAHIMPDNTIKLTMEI